MRVYFFIKRKLSVQNVSKENIIWFNKKLTYKLNIYQYNEKLKHGSQLKPAEVVSAM